MPMPRSLPCPDCGKMFLPSGLKFHRKACQQFYHQVLVQCQYCQLELPRKSLDGHVVVCKSARRAADGNLKEARLRGASWAPAAAESLIGFQQISLDDGRTRCSFCGRGFANARFHTHTAICSRLRQARPTSLGGIRTQLPQRIYNSVAARTTQANSFERHRLRLFIPRSTAESLGILVRTAGVARKIGSCAAASMTPWRILGVPRRAGQSEVRQAFKRLALEWHPDRRPADEKDVAEAKFKAISEAYEAMTRPRQRVRLQRPLALVSPDSWREKHSNWIKALRGKKIGSLASNHRHPVSHSQNNNPKCPQCAQFLDPLQLERHIQSCRDRAKRSPVPIPARMIPQNEREKNSGLLQPGMNIRIQGLCGAKHLNGCQGVVLSFDLGSGRWIVQVPGGETKAIKEQNLQCLSQTSSLPKVVPTSGWTFAAGQSVRLVGLIGAAQLNGSIGVIETFDPCSQRWRVSLPTGEVKALRLENMEGLPGSLAGQKIPGSGLWNRSPQYK